MTCSARPSGVGQQISGEGIIFLDPLPPRGRVPAIGWLATECHLQAHQQLRGCPDNLVVVEVEVEHVW